MAKVTLSKKNLKKNVLVKEPGLKPVECTEIGDPQPAKSGNSTNSWGRFNILTPEDEGIEISVCFNDSPLGQERIGEAVAAAEGYTLDELHDRFEGSEMEIDLSQLVGKKIAANVVHGVAFGSSDKLENQIEEFLPLSALEKGPEF